MFQKPYHHFRYFLIINLGLSAPFKSYVFDGIKRSEPDYSWVYDLKNTSLTNEFIQDKEFQAPFVGISYNRSDDFDYYGTWFIEGWVYTLFNENHLIRYILAKNLYW